MDIILNTRFNNPNLPIAPIDGFFDHFDRPAADSLGVTDDGKAWEVHDQNGTPSGWGTTGNGTAGMLESTIHSHIAVADARVADGALTGTLAYEDTSVNPRYGLAFRAIDIDNYFLFAALSSTNPQMHLGRYVAGQWTQVASSDPATDLVAGDTLSIILSGHSIRATVNGSTILDVTDENLSAATKHGMYGFGSSYAEWESIEFTPA